MKTFLITTSALGLIFTLTTTCPVKASSEATAINSNQLGKIVLARGGGGHPGGGHRSAGHPGGRYPGGRHHGWEGNHWNGYGGSSVNYYEMPDPYYVYPPASDGTY